MSYVQAAKRHSPFCHLAVFCRPKPLAYILLHSRVFVLRHLHQACKMLALWRPTCCSARAPRGGRCVFQVFVLVTAMRNLLLRTLPMVCAVGVSW